MTSTAKSVSDYILQLPEERKAAMEQLRKTIQSHLPKGFEETNSYSMIGYVVPHTLYPAGYHCDPKLPLPFLSIASQKNFIAVYHMGMYADPEILDWFQTEYAQRVKGKLDMGKSCVRFKKPEQIPFDLIGELCQKMSPKQWIALYEKNYKR